MHLRHQYCTFLWRPSVRFARSCCQRCWSSCRAAERHGALWSDNGFIVSCTRSENAQPDSHSHKQIWCWPGIFFAYVKIKCNRVVFRFLVSEVEAFQTITLQFDSFWSIVKSVSVNSSRITSKIYVSKSCHRCAIKSLSTYESKAVTHQQSRFARADKIRTA